MLRKNQLHQLWHQTHPQLKHLTEDAALVIVVQLVQLDSLVVTELMEAMVNLVHQVNVVTQLHLINPSWTFSPTNAHAKHHQATKELQVQKDQTDQLVTPVPQVEMANQVNKVQKVHQAKMAKPEPTVKKVRAVMLVTLHRRLDQQVPQAAKVETALLVLQVKPVQQAKMVNLVALALQVMLVQQAEMVNKVQQVQMVTKANKVIQDHAPIVHQPAWLQVIKEFTHAEMKNLIFLKILFMIVMIL